MNKQITKLLALMLVCSAALKADSDTNLTFVSVGGQRNVAELNMLTQRIAMRNNKGIGGTLQALPFFKQSANKQKLAELLSPVGKQTTSFGFPGTTADVIVDPTGGLTSTIAGSLELAPQHREFGVHLAWQQRLDVLLEGLFFEVDAPILNVRHQLNPTYTEGSGSSPFTSAEWQSYLEGTAALADDTLAHYKTYSGSLSKTGVADVAVRLGYNFVENEDYRFAVNVAFVAPTGGKTKSEFMFAPQLGGNNAWQAGAGATLAGTLYEKGDWAFRGVAELNYRYSFANTQERTLGLLNTNGTQLVGAQFASLYDNGGTSYWAANQLTTDLKVTGGSALNLLVGVACDYKGFSFDYSYELNGSAAEKVELAAASNFVANEAIRFGIAGGTPTYDNGVRLVAANLDYAPATNPSKITHKLASSLGYTFSHDQEYPVALGLGGSYTFGSNRSAFQGWGVFGKLGVSF